MRSVDRGGFEGGSFWIAQCVLLFFSSVDRIDKETLNLPDLEYPVQNAKLNWSNRVGSEDELSLMLSVVMGSNVVRRTSSVGAR